MTSTEEAGPDGMAASEAPPALNAVVVAPLYAAAVIAAVALALGYGLYGLWNGVVLTFLVLSVAVLATVMSWAERLAGLAFTGFVLLGAVILMQSHGRVWGLLGIVGGLTTWDLHHFRRRLVDIGETAALPQIIGEHLTRLFVVVGLGLALGLLAPLVQIRYSIGLVLLLSVAMAIGLSRGISFLRKESD